MIGSNMVVTRLYFEIPDNQGSAQTYTIDLARELSKHHRRLVRQKQVFTVYGGMFQDVHGSNAYISTAPHYWVTKRAINRSFKAWKKQISEAMNNVADADTTSPLRTGKWSDFKVMLDTSTMSLASSGSSGLLMAKDANGNDLPTGEWDYTTLTMPRPDILNSGQYIALASDQFDLMICGSHASQGSANDGSLNYSRVGMIQSWLDSRPLPTTADVPDDNADMDTDPLTLMFRTGDSDEDEKIIDAINDENDTPPYDIDKLMGATGETGAGSDLQMQCIVCPDTNSGVSLVPGFQAICGLIRISTTGDNQGGSALILDVESNGVGF